MNPTHDTFMIERTLAGSLEHVWAAWSDAALKKRWFVDSDGPGWTERRYELDFRIGGLESGRFELHEGPGKGLHENVTHYLDIVPRERIVFAYTMALDGRIHSASLATVTFATDDGGATRLVYTEQGAYFDGSDGAELRRGGWEHLLSALENTVREDAPA